MKYCKKCILSDNFFSVKIEENGLCNYCNENSANSTKVLDMGIKPREDIGKLIYRIKMRVKFEKCISNV